jgi:Rieske [2Fe-2S] domain
MQVVIYSSNRLNPRLAGPKNTSFLGSRRALNCNNSSKTSKRHTFSPQTIATPPTYSSGGSAPTAANQAPEEGLQSSSSASFDWKDHWYPVVFEYDVAPGQLYKFTLLNTPIVIWRDGAAVRAFKDACPHRLVPLSEGRIAPNGCLECPYHGKN